MIGRLLAWAVVAWFGALAGYLVWKSLGWPLIHDAPLMHYMAWRIGDGAVPYRDLFDMNQPGVYLIHLAVLRALGDGDLAWRVFDLGWLALGVASIAHFASPWGRTAALGGGLLFTVYHVANGAWQTGQRDFILCPLLVLAADGVARWLEVGVAGGPWRVVMSGLVLGAGITIKPHAALFAAALAVVIVIASVRTAGPRTHVRTMLGPVAAFVASLAVMPAGVLGWLVASGGFDAWRDITFGYLVPLYSRLGQPARWTLYRWHPWIPIAGAVLLSLASAVDGRRLGARHVVAVLGVGYGLVHFFGQRKGWEYHLYPLAAFAAVLAFSGLHRAFEHRQSLLAVSLLACLVSVAVLLGAKGLEASDPAWIRDKSRRVTALTQDLAERLRPGDTVQVLDTTEGGIHALLRLHVRQPTRFVYDFHFFHDTDTPVIRALRAEFLRDLTARPPRFVVVFERGWPVGGYARLRAFPELARFVDNAYLVVRRGDGYRILAKRDHP